MKIKENTKNIEIWLNMENQKKVRRFGKIISVPLSTFAYPKV